MAVLQVIQVQVLAYTLNSLHKATLFSLGGDSPDGHEASSNGSGAGSSGGSGSGQSGGSQSAGENEAGDSAVKDGSRNGGTAKKRGIYIVDNAKKNYLE